MIQRRPSLLDQLGVEYPEIPDPAVADAIDRAYRAACNLAGDLDVTHRAVTLLARDRLEILRIRAGVDRMRPFCPRGSPSVLP